MGRICSGLPAAGGMLLCPPASIVRRMRRMTCKARTHKTPRPLQSVKAGWTRFRDHRCGVWRTLFQLLNWMPHPSAVFRGRVGKHKPKPALHCKFPV